MANISSQSLFRFVSKREYLIDILNRCFVPRFSLEKQMYFKSAITKQYSYPMVCFCDIPLSQVVHHVSKYGEWGIGMKRNWGIQNNLTPVHYQTKDYFLNIEAGRFYNSSNFFSECKSKGFDFANSFLNKLYHSMLIKPYEDTTTRFYDEKEWRYIVSRDELADWYLYYDKGKDTPLYISEKEYQDRKKHQKRHPELMEVPLGIKGIHFTPDNINYLIVPPDNDILGFAKEVNNIKDKFSDDQKTLLISRIISVERIKNDF